MGTIRCGRDGQVCCWSCNRCPTCQPETGAILRGDYCLECTEKNKAEGLVWSEYHKNWVTPETKASFKELLRQQKLFREQHRGDYLVISAIGDWHEKVPAGSVGVFAGKGGRTEWGGFPDDVKWFLVPEAEYKPGMVLVVGAYPEMEAIR
jgi:hypothetical protein